jgi:endonuclease/exonuclease/phosphatase family metal-dependent hydrolase
MKVLSFNILAPPFLHGDYYEGFCEYTRKRKGKILSTLEKADADVVCLQEVVLDELDRVLGGDLDKKFVVLFGSHTKGYWDCHDVQHGNAILLNRSTTKLIGSERVLLSKDGNACLRALFWCDALNATVHVANVHLVRASYR